MATLLPFRPIPGPSPSRLYRVGTGEGRTSWIVFILRIKKSPSLSRASRDGEGFGVEQKEQSNSSLNKTPSHAIVLQKIIYD